LDNFTYLEKIYPDLKDFFVNKIKVNARLTQIKFYADILAQKF